MFSFTKHPKKEESSLIASINAHEANKKEAFEGMRAYHCSEIDHKKDAISIFQTLITSIIVIFTGLIAGIYNQQDINSSDVCWLAITISLIVAVCSTTITYLTNKKITKDNNRYNIYVLEYISEREIIGLEKDLIAAGHESEWFSIAQKIKEERAKAIEENRKVAIHKSGYSHTKLILCGLNIIVCLIGFSGVMIVRQTVNTHKKPPTKQVHIVIDSALKIK